MRIKILKETENELKLEIEEVGHTLCNLLQKELLKNEKVDIAGYDVPHPLTSKAIIFVRTKEKAKPRKILEEAVKQIQKQNKEFRKAFEKALK